MSELEEIDAAAKMAHERAEQLGKQFPKAEA
jgi:hypothetical protein